MNVFSIPVSVDGVVGPTQWDPEMSPPSCATLPELLDFQASHRPDAPALVAGESRLTYREFADRAHQFAAVLQKLGVTAQSRIALLAPNVEEWLVAAFGALRMGIPLDTFNTWVLAWDLEHLLATSKTEILITIPAIRSTNMLTELRGLIPELWSAEPGSFASEKFPSLKHVIVVGEPADSSEFPSGAHKFDVLMREARGAHTPPNLAGGESTAYVMYTSGTTQYPKAVPLEHRELIENGFAIGTRMGLSADDRVWLGSPLFWSFGGANAAMAAITHGACLVLQERFTSEGAAELLQAEKCTAAYLLPSMVASLAEDVAAEIRQIDSLRTGIIIGRSEEVRRAVVELDIPEICNVYGSTEVYGNCCVTPHTMPLEERLISQGPPLQGVQLRVTAIESGEVLPLGEMGELQIRGRVMAGYIGNSEATEAALTNDGWFRSGDTVLLRTDGTMQFISRHSDMIKTSGINVSPSEVESFLEAHPAVDRVAVVGAPHPARGEVPVAFVVLHPGFDVTGGEIRDYCKGAIASFKIPWVVQVITEIPQTSTGKMMRRDLKEPAIAAVNAQLASE
jgi:fatty-acyl-CoA synthase